MLGMDHITSFVTIGAIVYFATAFIVRQLRPLTDYHKIILFFLGCGIAYVSFVGATESLAFAVILGVRPEMYVAFLPFLIAPSLDEYRFRTKNKKKVVIMTFLTYVGYAVLWAGVYQYLSVSTSEMRGFAALGFFILFTVFVPIAFIESWLCSVMWRRFISPKIETKGASGI